MRIKDIQYLQDGGTSWKNLSIPQRKAYIAKFFKGKGYNDIQTHAIVGNLQQENGRFDTSFVNSSSGALGIAQWLGSRKKNLIKLGNPNDINTQLNFLHSEIQGSSEWTRNAGGKNAFFNAKDLTTAVKVFRKDFERPGEHEANDSKRIKYAHDSAGLKMADIPNLSQDNNTPMINTPNYEQLEYTDPNYQSIPLMNYHNSMMGMTQAMFDQIHAQAELDFQKEIKDKEEAELKSIQQQFETKQKEREQFLSMIPQVSSVEGAEIIQPKIMQEGGELDSIELNEVYYLNNRNNPFDNIPIYKDVDDFRERNKDVKTQLPFYDKGKIEYGEKPMFKDNVGDAMMNVLDYDIGDENGNIVKYAEECTARACRVVDSLVGGNSYMSYSDEFKSKIGANSSTKQKPTEEEISKNPHYYGDKEYGSLDAWDIAYMANKNSPNNVLYDAMEGKRVVNQQDVQSKMLSYNDLKSKVGNIPVGSFINLNIKNGDNTSEVIGGSHTVRVVGYSKKGEPLVADWDSVKNLKNAMYINGDLDAKSIMAITSVPGKEKYTYDYFNNVDKKSRTNSKENYLKSYDKLPLYEDGKISYEKAPKEYKKYAKTLNTNKYYITSLADISDEDYDRYSKIALALPGVETKYGKDFLYSLGIDGESTGLSQLVQGNVDEKYKKILSKYPKNSPEGNALSTVMYLKELDKYKDEWFDKGEEEQERPYYLNSRSAKGLLKDGVRVLQGKDKSGFYKNILGDSTYNVDGVNLDIPSREKNESDSDYINRINNSISNDEVRFDLVDRGGESKTPVIYKKTKGNTINRELEDSIGYLWQTPNAIKYGDAQGDNAYYKKFKSIYNELFNKK